ncbi:hypothetical protein D3C84_769040 [compost metagenome]
MQLRQHPYAAHCTEDDGHPNAHPLPFFLEACFNRRLADGGKQQQDGRQVVNQSALQTVQPHTVACSGIQRWLQANQKHQRRTAQQQRLTLPAFGSPARPANKHANHQQLQPDPTRKSRHDDTLDPSAEALGYPVD